MDEKQTLEALRRELTQAGYEYYVFCLLYTSPSPRD